MTPAGSPRRVAIVMGRAFCREFEESVDSWVQAKLVAGFMLLAGVISLVVTSDLRTAGGGMSAGMRPALSGDQGPRGQSGDCGGADESGGQDRCGAQSMRLGGTGGLKMEQPVDEMRDSNRTTVGEFPAPTQDPGSGQEDSCVGGSRAPTMDADHRGLLSEVEFPELSDAWRKLDAFVRRYPWSMLALGFVAGYWLSRSKVR